MEKRNENKNIQKIKFFLDRKDKIPYSLFN